MSIQILAQKGVGSTPFFCPHFPPSFAALFTALISSVYYSSAYFPPFIFALGVRRRQ
jgi:hypothetical protein